MTAPPIRKWRSHCGPRRPRRRRGSGRWRHHRRTGTQPGDGEAAGRRRVVGAVVTNSRSSSPRASAVALADSSNSSTARHIAWCSLSGPSRAVNASAYSASDNGQARGAFPISYAWIFAWALCPPPQAQTTWPLRDRYKHSRRRRRPPSRAQFCEGVENRIAGAALAPANAGSAATGARARPATTARRFMTAHHNPPVAEFVQLSQGRNEG